MSISKPDSLAQVASCLCKENKKLGRKPRTGPPQSADGNKTDHINKQ